MTSFGVLYSFLCVANAGEKVSRGKDLFWFFMSVLPTISVACGKEKHHGGECVVQEKCSRSSGDGQQTTSVACSLPWPTSF